MRPVRSRPVTPADDAFLFELFRSVRAGTLAAANLEGPTLDSLLRMQYAGQRRSYAEAFPDAEHRLLLEDDTPVGAIQVARSTESIRLVDIALLAERRGRGTGTAVLRGLQEEARASDLPIVLTVDVMNEAARRLYERLGFEAVGASPTQIEMVWHVRDEQSGQRRPAR